MPIPLEATPTEIAKCARQLSPRDVRSIQVAFESQSYEMASVFIWTRAASSLKRQIAGLGMGFVGEMLRRPDVDESSDPATAIGDYEAISLAEDLGMVNRTQAIRLNHALSLVNHFSDPEAAADEEMNPEEAVSILRSCVTSVLGSEHIKPPIQFAELRVALEEVSLQLSSPQVQSVLASPYFFQRTTLSVLLSLLKTGASAQLEHAIGNTNVLIPAMWGNLRKPERWQVGQAYAELASAGNRPAAAGLKKALTSVRGFDFVPESLRSNTFSQTAHKVLEAHFAINNFYNETAPLRELASLGSTIPRPAFPACMTAVLAVYIGNMYGHTFKAGPVAMEILSQLRTEQWEYYLNECLPSDKVVLQKLADSKPRSRWIELRTIANLASMNVLDPDVNKIVSGNSTAVERAAGLLRAKLGPS